MPVHDISDGGNQLFAVWLFERELLFLVPFLGGRMNISCFVASILNEYGGLRRYCSPMLM